MNTNEQQRQQLLADGYIKVGSKSYCEYWKKGADIVTVNTDEYDHKQVDPKTRDKRLMVFTSLLRTLNFVSHARVDQCYGLFVEFEEQHPLIDGYTRTGKAVDHTNMKMFITEYKGETK